jgi:hypothetical protein
MVTSSPRTRQQRDGTAAADLDVVGVNATAKNAHSYREYTRCSTRPFNASRIGDGDPCTRLRASRPWNVPEPASTKALLASPSAREQSRPGESHGHWRRTGQSVLLDRGLCHACHTIGQPGHTSFELLPRARIEARDRRRRRTARLGYETP